MEPSGAHTDTVRQHNNKTAFDRSLTGPPAEDNSTGRLPGIRRNVNRSQAARVRLFPQPGTMQTGLVRESPNGCLRSISSLGVLLSAAGRLPDVRLALILRFCDGNPDDLGARLVAKNGSELSQEAGQVIS